MTRFHWQPHLPMSAMFDMLRIRKPFLPSSYSSLPIILFQDNLGFFCPKKLVPEMGSLMWALEVKPLYLHSWRRLLTVDLTVRLCRSTSRSTTLVVFCGLPGILVLLSSFFPLICHKVTRKQTVTCHETAHESIIQPSKAKERWMKWLLFLNRNISVQHLSP